MERPSLWRKETDLILQGGDTGKRAKGNLVHLTRSRGPIHCKPGTVLDTVALKLNGWIPRANQWITTKYDLAR